MTIDNFIKNLELSKEAYKPLKPGDIYFLVEINGVWKEFTPYVMDARNKESFDIEVILKPL